MKNFLFLPALVLPLVALAQPVHPPPPPNIIQDSTEFARVLSFTPINGPPVARQVCSPVTSTKPAEHNAGGAILGGLTGALIGSRFGGGRGKDAATVAGAIGGAVVGDRIGSANSSDTVTQDRCETVYENGRPTGYQVTYEYQGQRGTVVMNHAPGEFVKVRKTLTIE